MNTFTDPAASRPVKRTRTDGTIAALCMVLTLSGCTSLNWTGSKSSVSESLNRTTFAQTQAAIALRKAEVAEQQGETDEAIRYYEQARTLDAKHSHVNRRLAVLYDRRGSDKLASAAYQQALRITPRDPDLLNDFGVFHLHRERWRDAEVWFRRSLSIQPKHPRATNNLAMSLAMQNRLRESFEAFSQVVGPAAAHSNLGVLLTRQGRTNEARDQFRRALAIDRTIPTAARFLARLDRAATRNSNRSIQQASYQADRRNVRNGRRNHE